VPDSEEALAAWLNEVGLGGEVADAVKQSGFKTREDVVMLTVLGAHELQGVLRISPLLAVRLRVRLGELDVEEA